MGRAVPPTGNRGHCISRNPPTPSPLPALTKFPFVRSLPPASVPGLETHVDAVGSWHSRRPRGARGTSLPWRTSLKTHTGCAAFRQRGEQGIPGMHLPQERIPQEAANSRLLRTCASWHRASHRKLRLWGGYESAALSFLDSERLRMTPGRGRGRQDAAVPRCPCDVWGGTDGHAGGSDQSQRVQRRLLVLFLGDQQAWMLSRCPLPFPW